MKIKVLMVCLGNICRSPLAEGVLKDIVSRSSWPGSFQIDSAGTANYHVGSLPDSRSRQVAINHGFKLEHKGRQFTREDFKNFDHILVMDKSNYANVVKLAKTDAEISKVKIITYYDFSSKRTEIVEDPYYDDINDFEKVYEQLVRCCEGFIKKMMEEI